MALSACKTPNEHPETLDPIYSDLMTQITGAQAKLEVQKKKVDDLKSSLGKLEARDPQKKHTEHQIENLERALVLMEQDAQYLEIRAQQRLIYDKDSYSKAFKADEEWPNPQDAVEYDQAKKLKRASRDWSKSVPLDTAHNKPVVDKKKKKEEKKEE